MKYVHLEYYPHDIQKAKKHIKRILECKIPLEVAQLCTRIVRILDRGKLRTIDKGGNHGAATAKRTTRHSVGGGDSISSGSMVRRNEQAKIKQPTVVSGKTG